MQYNKFQIESVCRLKEQGMSHRNISRVVFGKPSSASSVWYILNQYYYPKVAPQNVGPKICIFDIETAPELVYSWGRWKQNVGVNQVVRRSYMLTYAYKWLGSEEIYADALPYYSGYRENPEDDRCVVESIWRILDAADIVIAHNGINYDLAYLNSRFAYHGLPMPSPFRVIDTLRIAKKYFRFSANSLAELCAFFGVGTKLKTDFDLWVGCMEGDEESWEYMIKYNVLRKKESWNNWASLRVYKKQLL